MSGPLCCSNPPTLNPSSGTGHVEKLGGLDSYVTGSPDSKLAVLLISDIFGFEAPNLRQVLVAGCYNRRGVGWLVAGVHAGDFFHSAQSGAMLHQRENESRDIGDESLDTPLLLEQVEKNVFVVFYSGERAKSKILKICDAFGYLYLTRVSILAKT